MSDARLRKDERLKSRRQFESLFEEGHTFVVFPIRFIWISAAAESGFPVHAAFGISRRNWKKAVDRNRWKRRMREAYRQHKQILYQAVPPTTQLQLLCVYTTRESLSFEYLEAAMIKGLSRIAKQITQN